MGQEPQIKPPTNRQEIIHVLNRITYGPSPGDVEAVEKMGLDKYIDQQLHPETLDDSQVEQQVQQFELLQMTPQQLATLFFDDLKKVKKKQAKLTANAAAKMPDGSTPPMAEAPAPEPPPMDKTSLIEQATSWRSIAAIGQLEQAKLVRAINSHRQLQEVLVDFWTNHFNIDMKKNACRVLKVVDDREVIRPHIWGKFRDLLEASAKSPAMMVYLDNAQNSVPREPGPLEEMMQANAMQKMTGDTNQAPLQQEKKKGGINENYAREIMELHTLGMDGGYTQKDVQEVARCFTGWTLNRLTGEFVFTPRRHDNGAKVVLGHDIPAGGGIQDGEKVLDILASHPSTARHISYELCQRFVADEPSPVLVNRIAGVFQQTKGDLRQVVAAILSSPEFLSPASFQTKIKTPLEFAVSAVRATDSTIVPQAPPPFDKLKPTLEGAGVIGRPNATEKLSSRKRQSLNWHVYELGEPLFACAPPTGYKEDSRIWVSPGALIERLNFSMALSERQVEDIQFNPQNLLSGVDLDNPEAVMNQCVAALLQGNITDATRKILTQSALPAAGESKTVAPAKLIALILGSPEFQRK